MDIKWIQSFVTVAKYENIRLAAEDLYLTQPAVTKHIQKLEERLQSHLFHRNGKSIKLNAAGISFLPHAQAIINSYNEGMASFHSWQQGYTKKLSLAVAPQIASSILPNILSTFMAQYPHIEVNINIVNSYKVALELQYGTADVGLTRVMLQNEKINYEILMEEQVVFVGPNIAKLDEISALREYRLITHNHPVYWDPLLLDIHHHFDHIKTMPINQIEVTKRFIEQGIAVSYLPLSIIERELSLQTMRIIPNEKITLPKSTTYLLTREPSLEASLFCTFIKELIN